MYTLIIIVYAFSRGVSVEIAHVDEFESLNLCRAAKDVIINDDTRWSRIDADTSTVAYCVKKSNK